MRLRTIVVLALAFVAATAIAWGALRFARSAAAAAPVSSDTPITRVKRGSVAITVSARGALQGANAETLSATTVAQDT